MQATHRLAQCIGGTICGRINSNDRRELRHHFYGVLIVQTNTLYRIDTASFNERVLKRRRVFARHFIEEIAIALIHSKSSRAFHSHGLLPIRVAYSYAPESDHRWTTARYRAPVDLPYVVT
jgi:hypothetical protein